MEKVDTEKLLAIAKAAEIYLATSDDAGFDALEGGMFYCPECYEGSETADIKHTDGCTYVRLWRALKAAGFLEHFGEQ